VAKPDPAEHLVEGDAAAYKVPVAFECLGGTWTADEFDDEHGRGLAIVAAVAGDGNWGIDGDTVCRAAWFRLNWYPNAEERDLSL
jgi:hypothetical protein